MDEIDEDIEKIAEENIFEEKEREVENQKEYEEEKQKFLERPDFDKTLQQNIYGEKTKEKYDKEDEGSVVKKLQESLEKLKLGESSDIINIIKNKIMSKKYVRIGQLNPVLLILATISKNKEDIINIANKYNANAYDIYRFFLFLQGP